MGHSKAHEALLAILIAITVANAVSTLKGLALATPVLGMALILDYSVLGAIAVRRFREREGRTPPGVQ